ncbi:hypothetical protein LCGC14_0447930 [marine sediment metagenome]|uniref:Large polyvalent protein associated domain-containing protein n=1 Tax=marine sediment metagenome TaxID=412755 RepID=A0A0F9VSS6_9ZZZZ
MPNNEWETIQEEDEWETITEPRPKPTAIQKAGQAIKEVAAAPVRTLESMTGQILGGLGRMAAETTIGTVVTKHINMPGASIIAEHLIRKYGPDRALSFYDRKMKKHADAAKKVSDFWDEQANKGWEAPNPDIVEARWRDRPVSKTVSAVSSGLTSIGVVVGTTFLTKSPHAGLVALAASETGGMYNRLRNENVPSNIASKLAQMAGAWTFVTEKIGFDKLLKPSARTIMNILKKGGWEGAQEVIETMGHNLLEYFGYDYRSPKDIPTAVKAAYDHVMDDWQDALVGGIGAGGMVSVVLPGTRGKELSEPDITPPTVEELTKKPIEEIEPQTPDHAIGHQYGLTNEQVDNRLNEADLRYRELKLKETDERTPTERDELAFLSRNRTNIEAILERETQPVTPPKIKRSKKNLLVLGHKIAREAELTDEEYRDIAEMVTGKRSMKDMSMKEKNEFVSALEESYGTPKELLPEDYDMPITVAGRATSMRVVRNDAAKTTEALVDKKKVPATIKIGFGKTGAIQGFKNFFFGIDNTPPYHLARILDGGTEGIFTEVLDKGIEAGRKNSAAHTRSVMNALLTELQEAGITDADLAKMSKAVNPRLQTHQMISKGAATEASIININGQNFEMTMANLIDIYLISNQEAGMRHLTEGGLVIEGVETGALSEEQIADLRTRVEADPKALRVAVTVLKIGEQIWKPSINQVSQRMDGKDLATEPDWWGLEVYMPKRLAGKTRMGKLGQFGVNLIEDKGILKDRTRSTAPLVLRDALRRFSVFESATAEYVGMAEASRTSRTLLNDPSIAAALDQKGYNEVRKRIIKIHERAQSIPAPEGIMSAWFAARLPGLYRAVLFFNPRVVASQYTSAFNYGAYVSPEFMTSIKDGLNIENSLETLALSDIAWDRFHMGHSSLELGEATQADAALRMWTDGKSSDINKAGWAMKIADLGALTAGMEMAKKEYDTARTGKLIGFSAKWWLDKENLPEANTDLWRKVQEEGENADPEERQAVEQWRRMVSDRAEYLWQRTQPSWDRWNRSILTSEKGLRRIYLLFRSFHEKSLTIFNEAKLDYMNSAKTLDDKTAFAQKGGAVLTGYTVNMFLRLTIMAALTRKLKEPVKYFEDFLTSWAAMFPLFGKALQITVNRFVDTLAGAKTTYIGEVLESYPVRVVNMVLKSPPDMAEAMAHTLLGENEEAEEAFMRGINRFAEGAGTLSGVPVPEIKRVLPKEGEESTGGRGPARKGPPARRGPK